MKVCTLITIFLLYSGANVFGFESKAFPEFKIQTVDRAGNPVSNACVRMWWENYSFESREHCLARVTDEQGYAHFPATRVDGGIFRRIFEPVINLANVHSSSGLHAHLVAWKANLEGFATATSKKPLPAQIELVVDRYGEKSPEHTLDSVRECSCE